MDSSSHLLLKLLDLIGVMGNPRLVISQLQGTRVKKNIHIQDICGQFSIFNNKVT